MGPKLVPAGHPWYDLDGWGDLLHPSRKPCKPCCGGEPVKWNTSDNEDGNWTVQWMGLGDFE